MPLWLSVLLASVSVTPEPVTLQRALPATDVKPDGIRSFSVRPVAVALPVLVYVRVIVRPVAGDGPVVTSIACVTLITAWPDTVVTSATFALTVGANTLVAVTVVVLVVPTTAVDGITPATTNLKVWPGVSVPVVVIGVALSGMPSPLASA